ncbi:MAG: hypothetical protein KTR31_01330 [Myxococcales bacterium]|nr:hypothetical protein [Myxococcales bacterium]
MRKIIIGVGFLVALGCSGLGDTLMEMSGTEIAMGDDAEHPADHPLPPLADGEGKIVSAVSMNMAGVKTSTVQYEIAEGTSNDAVLEKYEAIMKEKGWEPTRSDQGGMNSVVANLGDNEMVTAGITDNAGQRVLTLVSVSAAEEEGGGE